MTTYKRRKEKLISELKDKEYRDAFVAEQMNVGISFQIKTIRNQRGWSQKKLGENVHKPMKQECISRLEDPNYASLTLSTLKKLASAFEVGLIVRFAPISDLVEWELGLTSDSLKAVSFDQDDYFKERPERTSPIPPAIATKAGAEAKAVDTEATKAIKEDLPRAASVYDVKYFEAIPDNQTFELANT